MVANANYDQILSTTLANYEKTLVDNIYTSRALFFMLKESGSIRKQGGNKIVLPTIYSGNTTASSYEGADTLSTTPQTGISASEYAWKQYAASVTISGIEEAMNNGEQEVIDLLQAKVEQAEESIYEGMDVMFFGDGTGNGGKNWNGLANLVAQNATAVGGIDPSTDTFWQSYIEATAEPLSLAKMNTAFNTVSGGSDTPNVILTTQTLYEKYEALLQPQERFTDVKTADGGFVNLTFKQKPVTYDPYCTAGSMYFLNTKYLKLILHSDKAWKATPFVTPANQDIRTAQILTYGNLCVSSRRRQGVLTGKTA